MRKIIFAACVLIAGAAALALGQTQVPGAVPVTSEHHHHLVFENEYVRIFDVEVPAHEATLLHQHDHDYLWLALGDADVINAVYGRPEARLQVKDGTVHFTRGGFAHIARNETDSPFRNVTIELLQPQTNPRNGCDEVLTGSPVNCITVVRAPADKGVSERPEFQTDQTLVTVLRMEPGAILTFPTWGTHPVLIAFDETEARPESGNARIQSGYWKNDHVVVRSGGIIVTSTDSETKIRNLGKTVARFLALEFKNTKP